MNNILISVVMAVYNTNEEYLRESIESILGQTYKNFEFLIVDDGSNSVTKNILKEYTDKRIRILENFTNIGLTKSLNRALREARGKYIARMDADDVSYVERLEKQMQYMERHPEVGVLGCWTSNNIDREINHWHGAVPSEWRRVAMLFANCGVCHPSAFIRRSVMNKNQLLYDERIEKSQDYELWIRLLNCSEMAVYPQTLLMYRIHDEQITVGNQSSQGRYRDYIRGNLLKELYPECSPEEIRAFLYLDNLEEPYKKIENILRILELKNKQKGIYQHRLFCYEMTRIWNERVLIKYLQKRQIGALFTRYSVRGLYPTYLIWRMMMYVRMHCM